MRSKFFLLLTIFVCFYCSVSHANSFTNLDDIVNEVKGTISKYATRAYCMVKRDCHQRVIYVKNMSNHEITINGCNFSHNQTVQPGKHTYSARKNAKGSSCQLSLLNQGTEFSNISLNPKSKQVTYNKHYQTICLTEHRVLMSWKKCPWCGKYNVMGYISACIVY